MSQNYLELTILIAVDTNINLDQDNIIDNALDSISEHYPEAKVNISTKGVQSEAEYLEESQLERGSRKLAALEEAGVDNWEGYDMAMDIFNEE